MRVSPMLMFLPLAALAEPPPYVPLDSLVQTADQIVVATPQRVEFQELEPGERLKRTTMDNFWVEYRVLRTLKGGLLPGQSVKAVSEVVGCVVSDVEVRREGGRFVEKDVHGGHERDLDPAGWLEPFDGPAQLLFLAPGEPLRSLHVSDRLGTTPADIAKVEKLIGTRR